MIPRKKLIISVISVIALITNLTFADWKENAKAIDVSGGEDHTLVLTQNGWPWGLKFIDKYGIIYNLYCKRSIP